jgi:hypothetical protein
MADDSKQDRRTAGDGTRARKPQSRLIETWRKAMRGDGKALEALLPLALEVDPRSTAGAAARRMVARALRQHAQLLHVQAQAAPEPQASTLRQRARSLFYQAVIARHVDLATLGRAPAPQPAPAEPACLLDPPPDAPAEVIAASVGLLNAQAVVRWLAPDNHGKAITGYTVGINPPVLTAVISYSGTQATVSTGLLPGASYSFTVVATNADGSSPPSAASNPVKIGAAPPPAPASATPRLASGFAAVDWTAPASGGPFTQYLVSAYDATMPPGIPARYKTVDGATATTVFNDLPKGTYQFGVRAFNAGGYGNETLSAPLVYTPAPTTFQVPSVPPLSADDLMFFDLGKAKLNPDLLKPDLLSKRMSGALGQAVKWRSDYLKTLAINAANQALNYEHFVVQLMNLMLTKVTSAELLLSPVLQGVVKEGLDNTKLLQGLAASDTVQNIIGKVADAAATAMSLEGLILFLLDNSPMDFWEGLFGGMIKDIASFNTGLGNTNKFLDAYFNGGIGKKIKDEVTKLLGEVDATVDHLTDGLRHAVHDLVAGTSATLHDVLKSFDNPLLNAVAPGTGAIIANADPLAPVQGVLQQLEDAVIQLIKDIKGAITKIVHGLLNGNSMLIDLVKTFIVYPILGVLVISFAGGAIAAGILAGIVMAAGIELVRWVARLLTGPLLDLVNDAKQAVFDALGALQGVFAREMALLDNSIPSLQMIAGNLAELRSLLPTAFLSDAAALIGEARRAVLGEATQLALAAERALGLEHATAFDVISTSYESGLTPAPQMPGGADKAFLAGAAMLRDFNVLERLRTTLGDTKELSFTHRLSLYKLLGGLGDPAGAAGEPANLLSQLLSGGRMLLHLSEQTLIDDNFPGLYRVLISDIRPIGVFNAAAAVSSALPLTLPLSVTHLGPAQTRVKRNANPAAPPVSVSPLLQLNVSQALGEVFLNRTYPGGPGYQNYNYTSIVSGALHEAADAFAPFEFGPSAVPVYRGFKDDGGHVYTTNPDPKAMTDDFVLEMDDQGKPAIHFYAYSSRPDPKFNPLAFIEVKRKDSPHDRLYTFGTEELGKIGDTFDVPNATTVFYVLPLNTAGTVPLYRSVFDNKLHFYTTDFNEWNSAKYRADTPDNTGLFCGVSDHAGPLYTAQPQNTSTQQVLQALLKTLPDRLGGELGKHTEGLLDTALVATTVRRLLQYAFATPLKTDAKPGPGGSTLPGNDALIGELLGLALDALFRRGSPDDDAHNEPIRGLDALLGDGHAAALLKAAASIAKWGGAKFVEDRDPQVRGMGFVTLVQQFEPETAVYNLLPDASPLASRLSTPPTPPDAASPLVPGQTLQYRPFENRAVEGDLLLSAEQSLLAGGVIDLLFEITVRACYDDNLAAAVRAGRAQRKGLLDKANLLAGANNHILSLPGVLPRTDYADSNVRTFNLSLRAHHDSLLQMANAAVQSLLKPGELLGQRVVDGLLIDFAKDLPLRSDEPLRPFTDAASGKPLTSITWQFRRQKPSTLSALAQVIPLTPEEFGLSSALKNLETLLASSAGAVAGIGVSVIPAQGAFPSDQAYDLQGISIGLDPLLQTLLPALVPTSGGAAALTQCLAMTPAATAQPVPWAQIWNNAKQAVSDLPLLTPPAAGQPVAPFLNLSLGDSLAQGKIHDVIISISVRIPVLTVGTTTVAVQ